MLILPQSSFALSAARKSYYHSDNETSTLYICVSTYVMDEDDTTIMDPRVDFFDIPIRFEHPTQVLFRSIKL